MTASMPSGKPRGSLLKSGDLARGKLYGSPVLPALRKAACVVHRLMLARDRFALRFCAVVAGWVAPDTFKQAAAAEGGAEIAWLAACAAIVAIVVYWLVADGLASGTFTRLVGDNRRLTAENEQLSEHNEELYGRLRTQADMSARNLSQTMGLGTHGRVTLLQADDAGDEFAIVSQWSEAAGHHTRAELGNTCATIAKHAYENGVVEISVGSHGNTSDYMNALATQLNVSARSLDAPKLRIAEALAVRIEDHTGRIWGVLMIESATAGMVLGHDDAPRSPHEAPPWCLHVLEDGAGKRGRAAEAARGFEEDLASA